MFQVMQLLLCNGTITRKVIIYSSVKFGNSGNKVTSIASYSDSKLAEKFVQVVKDSDIKTMRKILSKKGFDINAIHRFEPGWEKMTALHYAAREGMLVVMKELIQVGCDIYKETPFDMATPLHFACRYSTRDVCLDMVQELLAAGAEVNKPDHSQTTPLIIAVEMGHFELVRLLIYYGSELNLRNHQEDFPVALNWSLENLAHTEKEVDEMRDPFEGNTALIQACREHHVRIVEELLHRGCSLAISNKVGNTALHIACKSESRGNYDNKPTRTPIAGTLRVVEMLVEHGAWLDRLNKHRETPLQRVIEGIFEIGQWSIAEDAQIREMEMFYDIMKYLVLAGSSVCHVTGEGQSLMNLLLHTYEKIRFKPTSRTQLGDKFETVTRLFILVGAPLKSRDVKVVSELLHATPIFQFLLWKLENPLSLRELCRVNVRRVMHKPVVKHLKHLALPTFLNRYLTMEIL